MRLRERRTPAAAAVVALLVAVVSLAGLPASASAELRTSHYVNPETSEQGSATEPRVASMNLSYETSTGALDVRLRFFDPLADPTQTSGLRNGLVEVALGDAYAGDETHPECDRGRDGLFIQASLGNAEPPIVAFDLFHPIRHEVSSAKTFSADRSEVELTASDQGLVGLNLICATIHASNNEAVFLSHPILLDGFAVVDGNTTWSAEDDLYREATYLNSNLGHGGGSFPSGGFRCRGRGYDFACWGYRLMPAIPGRPTLTLRGNQDFTLRPTGFGEVAVWTHNERAALTWTHCPRFPGLAGSRPSRRCSLVVRWRHGGLVDAFARAVAKALK